jgi:hypothetical protein
MIHPSGLQSAIAGTHMARERAPTSSPHRCGTMVYSVRLAQPSSPVGERQCRVFS